MSANTAPTVTRRERWAWYWYDFGNSAYAAVVLLAVYSAYFKNHVVGGTEGTKLWGYSVGAAMLIVAIISPFLGTLADFSGTKKRLLFGFTAMATIFTAALFFVQAGDVFLGMLFFILAETGYRSAQVFYNSLLPEIASADELGKVSGTGWAIGSAGGILCLLIILPLIMMIPGTFMVRLSLVITAVFYAVFSLPLFLWLKERAAPRPLPHGATILSLGWERLRTTVGKARQFREFIKFIIAFLIYNDGVIMALNFAAIIGAVLFGMTQQQLIVFVVLVQATNVIGAYAFGHWADRFGSKITLIAAILTMLAAVSAMALAQTTTVFYIIGAVAGFGMAGVQSLSRTMVGQLSPTGQSAEFYGFFAVAGRTSSFIGPTVYGWVAVEVAAWHRAQGMESLLAEQMGQRVAILTIGAFLLLGLGLLLSVKTRKIKTTREHALPASPPTSG